MDAAPFRHSHRVTYADCAIGDHVYYSKYLEILEAARGEFFRGLGTTFKEWHERGVAFPVVECRLRYKAPARYDDELVTELWLTKAEGARLNFGYRVLGAAGVLIVEAETLHVCAGLDGKPARLPEALVGALRPHVRTAGQGC
jgi:acyl-CoA thioester hydrolase